MQYTVKIRTEHETGTWRTIDSPWGIKGYSHEQVETIAVNMLNGGAYLYGNH